MKKILFNDKYGLTQAVLEGRKTMTRRIINPQPTYDENIGICWKGYAYGINISKEGTYNNFISGTEYDKSCKRYRLGEVVAVAQKYSEAINPLDWVNTKIYELEKGWNNKMFVRADRMPHQVLITDIKIEKLQDISDEECIAEGIRKRIRFYYEQRVKQTTGDTLTFLCNFDTPREAFAALIDKVSGKGTWESNPYVFAYSFELVK